MRSHPCPTLSSHHSLRRFVHEITQVQAGKGGQNMPNPSAGKPILDETSDTNVVPDETVEDKKDR